MFTNVATRSIETLLRFLSDRRPKFGGALEALHINPSQSHQIASLSEISTEDIFALPNLPLSSLTPDQLLRFAQIVDTALFKSYLVIRPGLLGPLCRVPNWCEVSEVEEELRVRKVLSVSFFFIKVCSSIFRNTRNSSISTMARRCTIKR